jgi:ABC-type dipeptide/oligopeptide/nickel transport system permease component
MGKKSCIIETRSFVEPQFKPTECSDSTAQFYVQVFCYLSEEDLDQRYLINQILTFEVVLVNVIFLIFVHKVNKSLQNKYTEWDHKTTTISDYTVKYQIPDKLYERFVDYVYDMNEGEFSAESRIYAFILHSSIIGLFH